MQIPDYMRNANEFRPDWTVTYTVKDAEEILQSDNGKFEFNGVGWYLFKEDTILVLPSQLIPIEDEPQKFLFLIYNGRDPCAAFAAICMAPCRWDRDGRFPSKKENDDDDDDDDDDGKGG